jgi:hypothetical protein
MNRYKYFQVLANMIIVRNQLEGTIARVSPQLALDQKALKLEMTNKLKLLDEEIKEMYNDPCLVDEIFVDVELCYDPE